MLLKPRRLSGFLSLALVVLLAGTAVAQEGDPRSLWADFNHYVRIARPDLALAAGTALLNRVDDQQLLDVVEAGDYTDYEQTLIRAARVDTLSDIAEQFTRRIQSARVERSREPERISTDIERLAQGERANFNAIARLRSAGQYSAPSLLSALLDEKQKDLHPFVLRAMASVGRPMVYPLSVALPELEPVQQAQIAQVLAEIGYPRAIPALKRVIENPRTDADARVMVEAAYRQLASSVNLPRNTSAAELYLTLGQNHYRGATTQTLEPNADPAKGTGLVWVYNRSAGLVAIDVPLAIYGDVLAMRAAETALQLEPTSDAALSLWLASNLRRENRLAPEEVDPSYASERLPPAFYLEAAGPLRQHDVLDRALTDNDPALALDAINALAATAGTDALLNREGTVQPLLRALSYPDRRVRFAAAFTMTNARPKSEFPGSHRIVPVLAEALRQTDSRYAVVIGRDRDSLNTLAAAVRDLGYNVYGGLDLGEVSDLIASGPGVDLIVTNQSVDQIEALQRQTAANYRLAAVPTVAVVSAGEQIEINRRFEGDARLRSAVASAGPDALVAAVEQASSSYAGAPIGTEEAEVYALWSLRLLSQVALGAGIFDVKDAEPALLESLRDARPRVVVAAAEVIANINSPAGQSEMAEVALDETLPQDLRIQLLNHLAKSATMIGNRLNEVQLNKVLTLVKESQGDLAIVAARAHGALTLPTSNVVQLIAQ